MALKWRKGLPRGKAFAAVEAEAAASGARDPAAVAAAVGRKKLGQKEMTRRAVAGRKRKAKIIWQKRSPK